MIRQLWRRGGRSRRVAGDWTPGAAAGAVLGVAVAVFVAGPVVSASTPGAATGGPPSPAVPVHPDAVAQDTVSFSADVLPIFEQRCAKCHGGVDDDGEVRTEVSLNLLEYDRVMAGSEFGTVVEAGSAENSYLLEMIVEGDMPEEGDPVPADEIAVIRAWIEAGAPNN